MGLAVLFAVSLVELFDLLADLTSTGESSLLPAFWVGATVLTAAALAFLLARIFGSHRGDAEREGPTVANWPDAMDVVPIGVAVYDGDRRLVFCNRAWRRLFAESGGLAAIGSRYDDLAVRILGTGDEGSGAAALSGERQLPNGNWVRISEAPLDDGTHLVSARDVTEENRRASHARTKEERARLIISAAGAWIWETDVLNRFSRVTPVRSELNRDELSWMIGRGLGELAPTEKTSRDSALWKCIEDMQERRRLADVSLVLQDGRHPRAVRLSGVPRSDRDGTFLGYCGIGIFESLPFDVVGTAPLPLPARPADLSEVRRQRILLVDDSQTNRLLGLSILRKMGYACDAVENGRQAVDAVRDGNYGLVLMDIRMPVMDGFETTEKIRALPDPARSVHVVAMTAHASAEDRQRCIDAGMDEHIPKPVDRRILSSVLERLIGPLPAAGAGEGTGPHEVPEGGTGGAALADDGILEQLRRDAGPELVGELIASFMTETDDRLSRMRSAADSGDLGAVAIEAHAMKSSSGTFGALRLQRLGERLEAAATASDHRLASELLDALPDLVAESWREFARAGYPPPE